MENGNALGVEIKPESIYWNIYAKEFIEKQEEEPVIILEWGWTAGLTEEQLANYAEDAPVGKEEVRTTLTQAKELRDQLDNIINKYKV